MKRCRALTQHLARTCPVRPAVQRYRDELLAARSSPVQTGAQPVEHEVEPQREIARAVQGFVRRRTTTPDHDQARARAVVTNLAWSSPLAP